MATPTSLPATFVAGNVLTAAQMNDLRGAFRILQVVSTTKTDIFSTTSTSFVDVTGLSASITPTSATSKVFVMLTALVGVNASGLPVRLNLVRDSTNIAQSTGSSTSDQTLAVYTNNAITGDSAAVNFLDSPATTSATTYKLQIAITGGATCYVGRYGGNDGRRSVSTLTVMEVSA